MLLKRYVSLAYIFSLNDSFLLSFQAGLLEGLIIMSAVGAIR